MRVEAVAKIKLYEQDGRVAYATSSDAIGRESEQ
jgi:hypothetical protein